MSDDWEKLEEFEDRFEEALLKAGQRGDHAKFVGSLRSRAPRSTAPTHFAVSSEGDREISVARPTCCATPCSRYSESPSSEEMTWPTTRHAKS
jgi:hypothetical protein